MEAERLHLPAQVLELAVRGAIEAVRRQCLLELGDLDDEVSRRLVPSGERGRLLRQSGTGPAEPLGHRAESTAVGLAGEPPVELADEVREVVRVAAEPRRQGPRELPVGHDRRDGLHEPERDILVAAEHVVRLDPQRLDGDLGRHGRVAVAVAADPAAPLDERRNEGRPRAGRPAVRRGRRIERPVEAAVQERHGAEERLVEERHRRPHLVEGRRLGEPERRRPPEDRDLLAQPSPQLGVLLWRQAAVVEPLHERGAAVQREEEGPPAGLRRMRREDRGDREPLQMCAQGRTRRLLAGQLGERPGGRAFDARAASRSRTAAQGPHPMALLGEVGELEVEREGADERVGAIEALFWVIDCHEVELELVREAQSLVRVLRSTDRDRLPADALDEVEEVGAGLLGDDLAEEGAEELDLPPERVPGARRPDAAGLRADSGIGHVRDPGAVRSNPLDGSAGGHAVTPRP